MKISAAGSPIDIAVSGMKVQSARMNAISQNIANSNTTRTADGKPYRRQDVVVTSTGGLGGAVLQKVALDGKAGDFKRVLEPGHPDADAEGYVDMPNVDLPVEMMHMMTATRAYQANAAVLKRYEDMVDTTLELLR
jgi:flagellar basal-body rod protein FlgC